MLRSKRFWLAAVLLAILLICLAGRALRRRSIAEPAPLPAHTEMQTAVSANAQPETDSANTATQTEAAPADTEPFAETGQTVESGTGQTMPPAADETKPVVTEPASAELPYLPAWKMTELRDKTAMLAAGLDEFVGWIYLADSEIDYPVMQGSDNFYYLDHAPDGRYLKRGTIFLDCQNARDLSDPHSILFGHNMVSGMFGDIRKFRDPQEFERHRFGWFVTQDTVFRIDFFALAYDSARSSIYTASLPQEEWLTEIRSHAMYDTGAEILPDDRLIALSTCRYDSGEERALFVGRLVQQT